MKNLLLIALLVSSFSINAYNSNALDQAYIYSACLNGELREPKFPFILRPAASWEVRSISGPNGYMRVIQLPPMGRARVIRPCMGWSDFTDADLSGANLMGLNLSEANMSGANLRNAHLFDYQLKDILVDTNTIFPDGSQLRGEKRVILPIKKRAYYR